MPDETKPKKSPAFQFYPKDFLTDIKQIRMSLPAAGIYIRLLCHCWTEGFLLNDAAELARLSGATKRQINDLWPSIAPCFQLNGDGHLIHPRLEKELLKQLTFRQRQSDAGKASAAMRETLAANRASTAVEPPLNQRSILVATRPVEPARKLNSAVCSLPSAVSNLQTPVEKHVPERLDEDWQHFKARYPGTGREGGFIAEQEFWAACSKVGVETVMAGLERYRLSKRVREGYVVGMEKWLKRELWVQDADPPKSDDVDAVRRELAKLDAAKVNRG